MLDAVPERLELLAVQHGLSGLDRLALVGVLDLQLPGQLAEDFLHLGKLSLERLRQLQRVLLERLPQVVLDLAPGVHVARFLEVRPDGLRLRQRPAPWCAPAVIDDRDGGELVLLHDAEADARVGLDLLLEIFGKLLIALGGDDRQRVHVETAQPIPLLIHAEPQAAPDGLPALSLGAHFAEGANLEDVRVVPALLRAPSGRR